MIRRVPSISAEFTALERAVLAAICEIYSADQEALKAQLSTATIRRRENTGAGFFTDFEVQRDATAPVGGRRLREGPEARIEGLKYGMGFILWLKEGYANSLEGYAYGPERTDGIALEATSFQIVRGQD
jgi:hypothetical protein